MSTLSANTAPAYNLAAIMNRAWEIVKSNHNWRNLGLAFHMKRALMSAWHEAKMKVFHAKQTPAAKIQARIDALESKPFGVDISVSREALKAELAALTNSDEPEPTLPHKFKTAA